tara:strand:+ start:114 stop:413 length:300 start_codon:yes stop_codon:yes gene_type:complete
MTQPIAKDKLDTFLTQMEGWEAKGDEWILKRYAFKNFLKALNFANAVGFLAEKAMHHPDMKLGWGYVEINLQTHDVGGKVTDKDVELATQVEKLFKGLC